MVDGVSTAINVMISPRKRYDEGAMEATVSAHISQHMERQVVERVAAMLFPGMRMDEVQDLIAVLREMPEVRDRLLARRAYRRIALDGPPEQGPACKP